MKLLLIGDNRSNVNWGARGASIALYQMLEPPHEISRTIEGLHFSLDSAGYGYVGGVTPARYDRWRMHAFANRKRRRIFDWYIRLEELLGARDFIQPDPVVSAENILRYRDNYPALASLYAQMADVDAVVINGEGDMVFTTPPRREALFLLAMIELAIRLDKAVFFVNAIVSDCPFTGRNAHTLAAARTALTRCRKVLVRDSASHAYVRTEVPEADCDLVPDSLFTWYPLLANSRRVVPPNGDFVLPFPEDPRLFGTLDFSKPYICVGGSGASARDPARAAACYSQLVLRLRETGLPVYLCKNDGRDAFLEDVARQTGAGLVPAATPILMAGAIVANASLFVAGRYHAAILASLGGTPTLFLGSTAHKMSSLQPLLGYPSIEEFSPFPSTRDCDVVVQRASDYLSAGSNLRSRIRDTANRRNQEALRLRDYLAT